MAPSYDERDYKGISWSFGGGAYMKTEQAYFGYVLAMAEYWHTDPPVTTATVTVLLTQATFSGCIQPHIGQPV